MVITHIEMLKSFDGIKNYWKDPLFFNLGGLGVYFFFVLSGFLITYLLLVEKEKYKTISIKQFYVRRILRIWPLYYFILILGFFILPNFDAFFVRYQSPHLSENFVPDLTLYLFILPNIAFALFPAVPNIGQSWSIGVEEQFYIFWPWIIEKSKSIMRTLVIIIVALVLIKIGVLLLGKNYGAEKWYHSLKLAVAMSKFECMAIGGIGAYLLFTQHKYILYFQNKLIFIISLMLIAALIYLTPEKLQDGIHLVYGVLFLVVIVYCSTTIKRSFLDYEIFNFLGKISYGIYMYHLMIIPPVLYVYHKYINSKNEITVNLFAYPMVIGLTVLIAALSYHFLEKPFIKMKSKHSLIKSGDSD